MQVLSEPVEVVGPTEVWMDPSVEAEARGLAAAMSGRRRVEMRQRGRGEKTGGSATRQIRGCAVSMGGRQGALDVFLMA